MTRRLIMAAAVLALCAVARADEWSQMIGQTDQVTRGLVAYYSMRNSGTTVFDEWGGYNGGASNGVAFGYGFGAVGNGASFSNQYIKLGSLNLASSSGAYSAWIKPDDSVSNDQSVVVVSTFNPTNTVDFLQIYLGLRTVSGNYRVLAVNRTTASPYPATHFVVYGNDTVSAHAWSHIVYAHTDGSAPLLYVNGNLQALTFFPGYDGNTNAWWDNISGNISAIGARLIGSNLYFPGQIDEVRIYNRAITADEVKQLYRMGATPRRIKE